jgi:hypothetical protein
MISLNFRHILARSGIGKNDLSGDPGPHGPADPLEAQGSLRQGHPRRGPLEPAHVEVLDEGQPPQTKRETGQMHEAQDGLRRCALVVPQPKVLTFPLCCFDQILCWFPRYTR